MAKSADQLEVRFLGATGTVTGSKFLLTYRGNQILLDCGLFQGLKELRLRNWAPLPTDISSLRAVVLTHAHIDHSGYLPKLVKMGFRGDIFATPASCDLLRLLLPDSAHLQEEEARYANRRGYSKHKPALPLYTVDDANDALGLLRPVNYAQEVDLATGFSFRLYRTGHILGAAAIRIAFETERGKRKEVSSRFGRLRPIWETDTKGPGIDRTCRLASSGVNLWQSNASGKSRR